MKQRSIVIMFMLMLVTTQVNAQDNNGPYYYGLMVGQSKFHVAGEGDPTIAVYLGRDLRKHITIEGGVTSLGEGGDPRQSASASTVYGGGTISFNSPDMSYISAYATAGLHSWYFKEGDQNDSGIDVYYGFGLIYDIDEELSVRAGFNRYALNPSFPNEEFDEEITVVSFGVQYQP